MVVMDRGGPCAGVVEGDDFILKGGIRHAQKLLKRIRKGEGAFLAGFIHFDLMATLVQKVTVPSPREICLTR